MSVSSQLDAINKLSETRGALDGVCDLLACAGSENLNECKAEHLYFLLQPISDRLQEVHDMLYPVRS
jgi:hypothetical protein